MELFLKENMTGLSTLRNIRNLLHQTPVSPKPLRILAVWLDLLQRKGSENIPGLLLSLSQPGEASPLFAFQGILK